MKFELQHTDPKTNARAGLITTDHGQIETPIFMPVGTVGTVKGVHLSELKDWATPIICTCAPGWTSSNAPEACTSSTGSTAPC